MKGLIFVSPKIYVRRICNVNLRNPQGYLFIQMDFRFDTFFDKIDRDIWGSILALSYPIQILCQFYR